VITNDNGRPDQTDFIVDKPFTPGDGMPKQIEEAFVKMVIQPLERPLAIFRKQIAGQIERGKEENKTEREIRPEKEGDDQVNDGFEILVKGAYCGFFHCMQPTRLVLEFF
jgi:hypothetical protein